MQDDRRKRCTRLPGLKLYNPGINREAHNAKNKYLKHDEAFSHYDPSKWQTKYSLHDHCVTVSRVAAAMAVARDRDAYGILLSRVAGLFHDVGKLSVDIYRLNRNLSQKERKIVSKHARLSSQYLLSRLGKVRPEDRKFLRKVCLLVKWHHKPWRILRPRFRKIAWDIMLSDIFVALMESRHRPGLSQFEAIELLPELVWKKVPRLFQVLYGREIDRCIRAVTKLYGKENVFLSP